MSKKKNHPLVVEKCIVNDELICYYSKGHHSKENFQKVLRETYPDDEYANVDIDDSEAEHFYQAYARKYPSGWIEDQHYPERGAFLITIWNYSFQIPGLFSQVARKEN